MKARILVILLSGCLLGLVPVHAAEAVVHRKWGRVLDVFGARLFACKAPVHTRAGTKWRINIRVANHSGVAVRASAAVRRSFARRSDTVTKDTWGQTVGPGRTAGVDSVDAYDSSVGADRWFDNLALTVKRVRDGRKMTTGGMNPRGIPSCSLSVGAINWQGSGFVSRTQGRFQVCSNLFLDASGPNVGWRLRGDSTHTDLTLEYHAWISPAGDNTTVLEEWSATIPPGGFSSPGSLTQSIAPQSPYGYAEFLELEIHEPGSPPPNSMGGLSFKNIC